jgi:hypothetical protein
VGELREADGRFLVFHVCVMGFSGSGLQNLLTIFWSFQKNTKRL